MVRRVTELNRIDAGRPKCTAVWSVLEHHHELVEKVRVRVQHVELDQNCSRVLVNPPVRFQTDRKLTSGNLQRLTQCRNVSKEVRRRHSVDTPKVVETPQVSTKRQTVLFIQHSVFNSGRKAEAWFASRPAINLAASSAWFGSSATYPPPGYVVIFPSKWCSSSDGRLKKKARSRRVLELRGTEALYP